MNFNNQRTHIFLIILVTVLVYANIFQNEFVFDDNDFIVNRNEIRSFRNIPLFFAGDTPASHPGVYRPLRDVFYTFSFKMWGLNPLGYHFQSIIIHLICTLLLYFIAVHITKKRIVALMSSLIFGVHPIHTSAVTFIASSFDQIGIIFFLASLYFYIKLTRNMKFSKKLYLLSLLFALLAFFSYEIALTLPLVIILYDLFFNKINKINKNILYKVKIYLPYFVVALVYLLMRFFIADMGTRGSYLAGSFYLTMLTMSKVVAKEISLLLLPINLSIIHVIPDGIIALGQVEVTKKAIMAQSIFDFHVIASIFLILALVMLLVLLYKKQRIFSFCIAWFFITLLPVLNIVPIQSLIDEDWLYLPSFAFCLGFSLIIYNLVIKFRGKYVKVALMLFFVFIVLGYSSLTVARNHDWKDELTLWVKTVEQAPESSAAHYNLGSVYLKQGKTELAIDEFKKAIAINPEDNSARYNLGTAYLNMGKTELAIDEFKKAITINPDDVRLYNNLGNAYQIQGSIDLAIEQYKIAMAKDPNYSKAKYNLDIAYQRKNELESQ